MKIERFQDLLDRFGTDFDAWPVSDARRAKSLLAVSGEARNRYRILESVEAYIDASRPRAEPNRAHAAVRRAVAEIARIEARPGFVDRFRVMFATPLPRFALALSLTAMGFAIGVAVGNPQADRTAGAIAGPLTIASADDVLY